MVGLRVGSAVGLEWGGGDNVCVCVCGGCVGVCVWGGGGAGGGGGRFTLSLVRNSALCHILAPSSSLYGCSCPRSQHANPALASSRPVST